jgi:valyl-tRNA synthetase
MARLQTDLERARRKLDNPDFLNRAGSEVVEKEREKAELLLNKERLLRESLKLLHIDVSE